MAGFDSLPPLSGHPQTGHLWASHCFCCRGFGSAGQTGSQWQRAMIRPLSVHPLMSSLVPGLLAIGYA